MKSFRIPYIPLTVPKSVRFPIDILETIEQLIEGEECNFSAFVIEAVRQVNKQDIIVEKKEKFRILHIPTEIRAVKFPRDVVDLVEEFIEGKKYSFSAFVRKSVRQAIEQVKTTEKI